MHQFHSHQRLDHHRGESPHPMLRQTGPRAVPDPVHERSAAPVAGLPGQAVILAGGLGTRLRPYTKVIPKPLVPIGDRPVLRHIVESLHRDGVQRIDLCVSHLGDLIRLYFSQTEPPANMDVLFHREDEPLGTAGALRLIPDLDDAFIVMNGDVLTSIDYGALWEHHHERDAALTIAMHAKRVQIDLGVIEHAGGYVNGYIEKPSFDYHVSMGIYVYDRRATRYLPDGPCQFPELVWRLLDAGERVAAYLTDAEWFDIGTLDEYERASRAVELSPETFGMGPVGPTTVSPAPAPAPAPVEVEHGAARSPWGAAGTRLDQWRPARWSAAVRRSTT
jgi:NDP-sugar pyrophosphorylase family protein